MECLQSVYSIVFQSFFFLIYHLHDIADARHFQNFPDAPVGVNHIHLASKTGNLAVTPRQYADAGAVHKFCVGKSNTMWLTLLSNIM